MAEANNPKALHTRPVQLVDAKQICEIYNHYISNTTVTFEEEPIEASLMAQRIGTITPQYPWLIGEIEGKIIGYAYATKWKERSAYRHTVESTIYLKHDLCGNGFGKILYGQLVQLLQNQGCHAILGCIATPNRPSEALHEHFGFEKVAHFCEVGRKFNQWLDIGYWQKNIQQPQCDIRA